MGHPPRTSHESRYRDWIGANPLVLELALRVARRRLGEGRRFGIAAIVEDIRWEYAGGVTPDGDGFRINNSFRAYLARDLLAAVPGLKGLLEIRRLRPRRPPPRPRRPADQLDLFAARGGTP